MFLLAMKVKILLTDFAIPSNVLLGADGLPVSSDNKQDWLKARMTGVTATDINKIVSPTLKISSQSEKLLKGKLEIKEEIEEPQLNSYMVHGNEREPIIAEWALGNFDMQPNNFLFYGLNSQHLATPDGIGKDFAGEIKTSLKPLKSILGYYMNQMQWQLNVMQMEKCLFIVEQHESFKPLDIDYMWVYRDEERINFLIKHVDEFIYKLNHELHKRNIV